MATSKKADQHILNEAVMTDDDFGDFLVDALKGSNE
jgi:hypothetical protein